MLKIGEFSKVGKVSIRTLRYYDEIGLLKPIYIDDSSGYRGYSVEQLPKLNRIVFLKSIGFSLNEVMELIDDDISIGKMKEMLQKKQIDLENKINMAQINLKQLTERLTIIEEEGTLPKYEVVVKRTAPYTLASHRVIVPHMHQMGIFCYDMYDKLYSELERLSVTPSGPEITFYYNEEYSETDLDMETAIVIPQKYEDIISSSNSILSILKLEAEENVATLLYQGPFDGLDEAVIELLKWIGSSNWKSSGALREVHLSGPAHLDGEVIKDAVVELQIPIIKNK